LLADCGISQVISLSVALARDVRDRKLERPGQLAADPVQGIEARAAAGVLPLHLANHDLGVRIDVQRGRFEGSSALQGLQEGYILGYIVVLTADPARNADGAAVGTLDHDANTGGPGVPQRSAIHVGYEVRHSVLSVLINMRQNHSRVKFFIPNACNARRTLWNNLWKRGIAMMRKQISITDSSNYNFRFAQD
jgi:hypothetical protein